MSPVFKTQEQCTAEMLSFFIANSGMYNLSTISGSIELTLFQAVAFEYEQITFAIDQGLKRSILTVGNTLLNITPPTESHAVTTLRFERSAPADEGYLVPAGTTASAPNGTSFSTLADVILQEGSTFVDTAAVAVTAGSAGNTDAGTITLLNSLILGIETVSNPVPATGGRDAPTETELLDAVSKGFAKLSRGTLPALTVTTLSYTAPNGDRAVSALAVDRFIDPAVPPSTVRIYVYRPGGCSPQLLTGIRQHLNDEQQRGAGILLEIMDVPETTVNLTVQIRALNASVLAAVEAAARAFFENHAIGEDVLVDRLTAALGSVPGVYAATVISPTANTSIPAYTKAVLGSLNLQYISGGAQ